MSTYTDAFAFGLAGMIPSWALIPYSFIDIDTIQTQ
jgi:hypothetical protein